MLPSLDQLQQVLKRQFGHDGFHQGQGPIIQSIIQSIIQKESSLVVMPTGSGKSLCYQLPSQFVEGLVVVISPLITLMKDQVDAAQKKGLKSCFINSSLSVRERVNRHQGLKNNRRYDLIYVTPERFRKEEFPQTLSHRVVSILAIDEAHCISMWGHDFRPDYSRMKEIRNLLNNPPTMALTTTATPQVRADILEQLGWPLESTKVFISGFQRLNLKVQVSPVCGWDDKIRHIVGLRHLYKGPVVIYFSLVSSSEERSHQLHRLLVKHLICHDQQPREQRRISQEEFLTASDSLTLATPTFGLGVNKSDIRLVIHTEILGSVETYYQEIGRAGRDGLPSHCRLAYIYKYFGQSSRSDCGVCDVCRGGGASFD